MNPRGVLNGPGVTLYFRTILGHTQIEIQYNKLYEYHLDLLPIVVDGRICIFRAHEASLF